MARGYKDKSGKFHPTGGKSVSYRMRRSSVKNSSTSGRLPKTILPKLSEDNKTRLEGIEGVGKTMAEKNPIVNNINTALDIAENVNKMIDPASAREGSVLNKIRKF